ncbi:MAG: class I SAM-dependent methyltransferase [Alphaproteobacteria bacterium]|nr:MAG: class I SAM-dependent methyltransferase [Alphaproteobacteria bacterium]
MTTDPYLVFLDLHLRLPRQGPGGRADTEAALKLLPRLRKRASILDLGCGTGAQTFDLLALTEKSKTRATAIDILPQALHKLVHRAEHLKIPENRLAIEQGDMEELDLQGETFDLVWSEGAIYVLGFQRGLELWQKHLAPGGHMVVSEWTWLTDTPSSGASAFWRENYPGAETIAGNIARAEAAGYACLGTHEMPATTWEKSYYAPMEQTINEMKKEFAPTDLAARRVLAEAEREIETFRKFGGEYTYVFYALERRG